MRLMAILLLVLLLLTSCQRPKLLVHRDAIWNCPEEVNKMLEQEGITNVRVINESEHEEQMRRVNTIVQGETE